MRRNRFQLVCLFLLLALVLSGCKLSVTTFTAPDAALTGDVIVLHLDGKAIPAGTPAAEYGLVLQIPESWQVISGKASVSPPGLGSLMATDYKIRENPAYAERYRPEPGHKIWVGTCTPFTGWPQMAAVTASVNVVVGDFEGEEGETRTYHVKMAAAALRNGVWTTDAPPNFFAFSAMTHETYVESIDVTKIITPFEDITPEWAAYPFDHPFFGVVHAPTDGHYYVVQGNNQILELDEELNEIATIAIESAECLTAITYLNGFLWVGDARGANYVYKLDLLDNTSQAFEVSSFPDGIGTDGQLVYVVDQDASGVLNGVDPDTGEKVRDIETLVQDPVGITYDGSHLLVLDENGAIYRVDPQTGHTHFLFLAPGSGDENTYYGSEGISYIAGYLVIGYGMENTMVIGKLAGPASE